MQHSRSFSRRPHSYHQSQFSSHSSTLLPSSSIINSHYSSPHLTQEASLFLSPYRQESSVTSKYQRPKSPDQMTDESCSTLKYEHHPTKVHDTASNVSYQSHHSHHHHNHHHQNPDRHSQYSHLTRSQVCSSLVAWPFTVVMIIFLLNMFEYDICIDPAFGGCSLKVNISFALESNAILK